MSSSPAHSPAPFAASLIALLISAGGWSRARGLELVCPSDEDGDVGVSRDEEAGLYWATPRTSCSAYYSCTSNGTVVHRSCPQPTIFDYRTQKCESSGRCYEVVCAGRGDGDYLDATHNCTRNYRCSGGLVTRVTGCRGRCPAGAPGAALVVLDRAPPPSDSCSGRGAGYYTDPGSGCSTYFYCLNGNKIVYVCPRGSVYDGDKCVEPHRFKCPYPGGGACLGLKDGYHKWEGGGYIYCWAGRKVASLPPARRTSQPHQTDCSQLPDGFYQDLPTGCKSYFYCIGGVRTVLNCPPGHIYNGDLCVDERSYSCPVEETTTTSTSTTTAASDEVEDHTSAEEVTASGSNSTDVNVIFV